MAVISEDVPLLPLKRRFDADIIHILYRMLDKNQKTRISIVEILNHPRILRCIDEYRIEVPESLCLCITTPSNMCSGYVCVN